MKKLRIMKTTAKPSVQINNRKAYHDYEIFEELEAGIVLYGGEIKSVRKGNVSIKDGYCTVSESAVLLHGCYIKLYENAGFITYDENHDKVLLLKKREIEHIRKFVETKGCTAVPVRLYINSTGLCKVVIGLCKGKHTYDKKTAIAERDIELDKQREIAEHYV